MDCPDESLLVAYGQAQCTPAERRTVASHLDGCDACRMLVATLVSTETSPGAPRAPSGSETLLATEPGFPNEVTHTSFSRPRHQAGDRFGRFILLEKAGKGAMGE